MRLLYFIISIFFSIYPIATYAAEMVRLSSGEEYSLPFQFIDRTGGQIRIGKEAVFYSGDSAMFKHYLAEARKNKNFLLGVGTTSEGCSDSFIKSLPMVSVKAEVVKLNKKSADGIIFVINGKHNVYEHKLGKTLKIIFRSKNIGGFCTTGTNIDLAANKSNFAQAKQLLSGIRDAKTAPSKTTTSTAVSNGKRLPNLWESNIPIFPSRTELYKAIDSHENANKLAYEFEYSNRQVKLRYRDAVEIYRVGNLQWSQVHPATAFIAKSLFGGDYWPETSSTCHLVIGTHYKMRQKLPAQKYYINFNDVDWKTLSFYRDGVEYSLSAEIPAQNILIFDLDLMAKQGQSQWRWRPLTNKLKLSFPSKSEAERRLAALKDLAKLCPKSTSAY